MTDGLGRRRICCRCSTASCYQPRAAGGTGPPCDGCLPRTQKTHCARPPISSHSRLGQTALLRVTADSDKREVPENRPETHTRRQKAARLPGVAHGHIKKAPPRAAALAWVLHHAHSHLLHAEHLLEHGSLGRVQGAGSRLNAMSSAPFLGRQTFIGIGPRQPKCPSSAFAMERSGNHLTESPSLLASTPARQDAVATSGKSWQVFNAALHAAMDEWP